MDYADSCLVRIPVGLFDFIPMWDCQSGALSSKILTLFVIVTEPKSEVYSDTQEKLPYYLGIYWHFNFSQLEIKDVFFFNRT